MLNDALHAERRGSNFVHSRDEGVPARSPHSRGASKACQALTLRLVQPDHSLLSAGASIRASSRTSRTPSSRLPVPTPAPARRGLPRFTMPGVWPCLVLTPTRRKMKCHRGARPHASGRWRLAFSRLPRIRGTQTSIAGSAGLASASSRNATCARRRSQKSSLLRSADVA